MIVCSGVSKSYRSQQVLGSVSITVGMGEQVAIMGPSGAGKTTLLHCLAGLESPDSGTVSFFGQSWAALAEKEQRSARLHRVGLLFQSPDLLTELTVVQNVSLPLEFCGVSRRQAERRAAELLSELGLEHVLTCHPAQISGGEAQRAALARAVITRPAAVLADEPTGSLDTAGRDAALQVLTGLTREVSAALVVVTHDPVVAAALDRTVILEDGVLRNGSDAR